MTEAFPFIVTAGVVILVLFEAYKWVKSHPSSSIAAQVEAKLPPAVNAALGLQPAVTGEHLVAAVTATGQAVATAVQAVAVAQKPQALLGNSGLPPVAAVAGTAGPGPTVGGVSADQAALFLGSRTVDAVLSPPAAAPSAPPAAPAAFDPIAWGKRTGAHFDHEFADGSPVSFDTVILAGASQMSCGAGQAGDTTPVITAGGVVLVTGYGVPFKVDVDTPAKVTVTPNKVPAGCSINLTPGFIR